MTARTFNGRLRWRERRAEIVRRDGGRCVLCGEQSGLTAHHIKPRWLSEDDSPANLVALCSVCHDGIEQFGRQLAAYIVWIIGAPLFRLARIIRKQTND
jgi:5-methylcytosine-specific restriction endonuclease McrA